MTRLFSDVLQTAVFYALQNGASGVSFLPEQVFEAPPLSPLHSTYVLIGEDKISDRSDATNFAAIHEVRISVVTTHESYSEAKKVASDVCVILTEDNVSLTEGKLCRLHFRGARAGIPRGSDRRQITLTFRAFIDAV